MGAVSAILGDYGFEDMIDILKDAGFSCVEAACWPQGKAERRYAGVSHISVENMEEEYVSHIKNYCKERKIEISALAYYPNPMDADLKKRGEAISHLKKVILAGAKLNVGMVTTFIGRDQTKTVEENLKLFQAIWPEIVLFAKERGVKIAIENCPMLFGPQQWPGGQNLATSPAIWREMFRIIPEDNFGLNYDPSHFVWQKMDYIAPLYEFQNRIFHVHFKDIKLHQEKLNQVGILAYPLDYMSPKIPGLGDVNWGRFVSALTDIGYDGAACIEIEDRAFEGSREKVIESLHLARRYMSQYVI